MQTLLVLASGSPRRRELLAGAGFEFKVAKPILAEVASRTFSMGELTTLNATRKALEIARAHANSVILGADTLVCLEGEIIGKPADMEDARRILRRLRGRTHEVCTGVYICAPAARRSRSFRVISRVRFRSLGEAEIDRYLETVEPLDKAGAYAAQGRGREIIEEIHGSYSNVVGLPLEETTEALRSFGLRPGAGPHPQVAGVRQQISSLFPSGSSKKRA